jgi:hypothetical protein
VPSSPGSHNPTTTRRSLHSYALLRVVSHSTDSGALIGETVQDSAGSGAPKSETTNGLEISPSAANTRYLGCDRTRCQPFLVGAVRVHGRNLGTISRGNIDNQIPRQCRCSVVENA